MKKFITKSEKQTIALGKKIAKQLHGKEVLGLIGELGAGKTVFIKGLALGLDIKKTVTSPTFVLIKIYKTKKTKVHWFCHVDAYRLNSSKDLIDIGLKDWLNKPNTVTVIEWAEKVKDILPKNAIIVTLKIGKKQNERVIKITNLQL